MARRYIITGTGTGIGKTVFSAGLAGFLGADYWKPIQSGLDDEGGPDAQRVEKLSGVKSLPSAYILQEPLSPHIAAEIDGVEMDLDGLTIPETGCDLVIEGAGGVLVPLSRKMLSADLFARWGEPVILCATTVLGTISHTLSAIESLRSRGAVLHGMVFIGPENLDSIRTIADFSGARMLGRLPILTPLNAETLSAAMQENFNRSDFE